MVCTKTRVVGYYALAVGAVAHVGTPGSVKRNVPDAVPVMVLGRLAVDKSFKGRGIGSGLLRDAVLRTVQAAEIAGIRAIVVHAISDAAKRFYQGVQVHCFADRPDDGHDTVAEARRMLGQRGMNQTSLSDYTYRPRSTPAGANGFRVGDVM